MKPKISYLSTFNKRLLKQFKPSKSDIYFEPNFLRLWTFIFKYGNVRQLNPVTQAKIEAFNHGRCIGTSMALQEYYFDNTDLHTLYASSYVEGITNYAPINLHAWNNITSSRHEYAVEFTRDIDSELLKTARYAGVEFDIEFVHWLRKVQDKNPSDILPYLVNNGKCCLTYRPLLDGKLKDYPIYEEDIVEAFNSIVEFLNPV